MENNLITGAKDVAAITGVVAFYMFAVFGCLLFV